MIMPIKKPKGSFTMEELKLVTPAKEYGDQVMQYKAEMLDNGDCFDGCAGLEKCDTYDEWLCFEKRLRKMYGDGYVPSEVYLSVRICDNKVVGIMDFRTYLSEFLLNFGGSIGYSILPSERRKGYASESLKLLLDKCREKGADKVLINCDKENIASARTIIKNGGILENEVRDTAGLTKSGIIQRYWITL